MKNETKKCAECFTNDKIALEIPLCHIVRYATAFSGPRTPDNLLDIYHPV